MSRNIRKRTFGHVRPAKNPTRLRILIKIFTGRIGDSQACKVYSTENQGSDQTARMSGGTFLHVATQIRSERYLYSDSGLHLKLFCNDDLLDKDLWLLFLRMDIVS